MREDKIRNLIPSRHRSHFSRSIRELKKRSLIIEVKRGMLSLTNDGFEVATIYSKLGELGLAVAEKPTSREIKKRCIIPLIVGSPWRARGDVTFHINSLDATDEIDVPFPGGDYYVHKVTFSFRCPKCFTLCRAQLECGAKFYATESEVFCDTCGKVVWMVRRGNLTITHSF